MSKGQLVEITPDDMRCGLGACPAIFRDSDGNFVIIGKKARDLVSADRVAADETVIAIPKELLAELMNSSGKS